MIAQGRPGGRSGSGHAYGRVLDENKKPVAYASVRVTLNDSLVGGALVQENGNFDLPKLPTGSLHLRIAAMGYTTLEKGFTLSANQPELDLGNMTLVTDVQLLKAAEITKERATQVLQVDRRVYNVDKDLSVAGGDATDVMKNIPGLSVDAEGAVEMRGKHPQVMVDGRPTTLTLDQIPAADIERVEVITNPSVIFDASTTGGIVNVVMKKSTRPGYSGQLQAGVGSNERYNVNGNLLMREGRSSINLSYGFNKRNSPGTGYSDRTDLADGLPIGYFNQDATTVNGGGRQFVRAGWDYKLSNRNTFSLTQSASFGSYERDEEQIFTSTNAAFEPTGNGDQHNLSNTHYANLTSQVSFRRTTTKPGKEWSTDFTFNLGNTNSLATTDQWSEGTDNGIFPGNSFQTRDSEGDNQRYTWQLDVTDPYADNRKFDWGFKSSYNPSESRMDVFNSNDTMPTAVFDTTLSNAYFIREMVNAAYVNWSTKLSTHWSLQAGLRFEQNWMDAKRTDKDLDFSYSYPDGFGDLGHTLFPAIYFSHKWDAPDGELQRELQVNVSRKIERPRHWQMMPFIMSNDARSYRIGNPTLRPEMSTIIEVNHMQPFSNSRGNWLSSVYGRFTTDVITNYTAPLPSDPTILVSTYVNGDQNQGFGWENAVKLTLWSGSEITISGDVQWVQIGLDQSGVAVNNTGVNWDGKLNFSQKLPQEFTVQVNGDYDGPRIIPQGTTAERYSMDVTVRKEFGKHFFATVGLNNAFNSSGWGTHYETPYFIQDDFRTWGSRELRVSATWRFGKQDAPLFRRKGGPQQRREPGSSSGGGMEGE